MPAPVMLKVANGMMLRVDERNRDRLGSAIGVGLFHALLGYAFLTGLGFQPAEAVTEQLKMFDVFEQPPPPPSEPAAPEKVKETHEVKPKDPEGAASPANLRDTPSEIVAPPPEIRLPVPPPVVAAPVPGQGSADSAGAADVPGPGTGRGGFGNGLGSGSQGNGTGGGGGGIGRGSPVRWLRGRIYDSDYPSRSQGTGNREIVYLRFVVDRDGRVRNCAATRSSGNRELDETTCRLIEKRFRYRPARNAEGLAIPVVITGLHDWDVRPEPPPIDVEPDIPDDE
ncbi:MAG TPA: TonB family protein [Allosphingosinicella sp.]|jgi:protein TonB